MPVKPNVIVLTNDNPAWNDSDRVVSEAMVKLMLDGLRAEGHTAQRVIFFDDLSALEAYNPREWLIWNWGEEMAGVPWTEALVAGELERRGFAYTGATPEVLERTKSRDYIKAKMREAGLPILPSQTFTDPAHSAAWTHFPAIVKGANQHASYGITRDSVVYTPEALAARIAFMRAEFNDDSLVEPFLDSREFQVPVWGNGQLEALPPLEYDYSYFTDARDHLYSYQAKFERASIYFAEVKGICPAPVDRPDWYERLQDVAVAAYRAAGLRDYGRIDCRMLGDEPQVLDVNPNPDMDPISVHPLSCETLGLNYGQMASRILSFAAERMPR
jgi:D-alanine-D-alanine ligase